MAPVPILDRPGRIERLWPLSVEAYHALGEAGLIPEKTELLYGFVFNKMPKSPIHTYLAGLIASWLRALQLSGMLVRQEQPLTLAESEPEPDIAVVIGAETDFIHRHPGTAELAIEIAVSSHDYDRDKAAAYAAAGIPEFWIVLVPERKIEVYRQPVEGTYTAVTAFSGDENVASIRVPDFAVKPSVLFDRV